MAGGEQAGQQGGFLGPSPTGVPGGSVVNSVATTDPSLDVAPTTGNVLLAQNIQAQWPTSYTFGQKPRFFACDGTVGVDTNQGWSDTSQAAAGLVAVKTLNQLFAIVSRFGRGRACRVAIRAGNYNSPADAQLTLDGFCGQASAQFNSLLIIGTDTVLSAGAVAFQGDVNDSLCSGFTTATGMNAAGYNATVYTVAADGTPSLTAQLAGGGAPGFPAAPARPDGCRIRFDVATATVALRNVQGSIIGVTGGNTLILGLALPAVPVVGDIFYIEMPGVLGPAATVISNFGDAAGSGVLATQICGIQLGALTISRSTFNMNGCECAGAAVTASQIALVDVLNDEAAGALNETRGNSIRCSFWSHNGGTLKATAAVTTSAGVGWTLIGLSLVEWERSGAATGMQKVGGDTFGGNNIIETIGTNSSTIHGATCQFSGTGAAGTGFLRCGLFVGGSAYVARNQFTGMGANPALRVCGVGLQITLQGVTGSTGNTDVGLDLTPSGAFGNTVGAMGCTIAIIGTPTVTGTAGDVRLSDGTIITWAQAMAGVEDINGNRLFAAGDTPTKVVAILSGVLVTNAGTSSSTDLGNPGFQPLLNANATPGVEYPTSQRLITRMRVAAPAGNGATPVVVTLARRTGGVRTDTTMTATIPGGAGAWSVVSDLAHPQLFLDGDLFAVHADSIATGEGNKPVTVTLEGP